MGQAGCLAQRINQALCQVARVNALPDDLKKLIDTTTGPARAEAFGKVFDEGEKHGRQYMLDKKVEITKLSDAELANIRKTLAPIVEKATSALEKEGKPGAKFLEADGSITKEIMPDFLHLSSKGYQIWADAIGEKLAALMH